MPGYLVEYNRLSGDWRVTSFLGPNGHRDALVKRLEVEESRPSEDWEIVSLNSDSLETVKKTHARYFEGRELDLASA